MQWRERAIIVVLSWYWMAVLLLDWVVLSWVAPHSRRQLQEEPALLLRMSCCELARDWIRFQKCLKEMPSPAPTPIFRKISDSPWSVPMPLTRLGIWVDRRLLNSSVLRVGLLSGEAEWNCVTSVLMAFSRSEYCGMLSVSSVRSE